jgi:diguanylate cyclase (GGDEF)-like protein/PAS domain S-box-containing protein
MPERAARLARTLELWRGGSTARTEAPGTWWFDPRTGVFGWDETAACLLGLEEAGTGDLRDAILPDDRAAFARHCAAVTQDAIADSVSFRVEGADGIAQSLRSIAAFEEHGYRGGVVAGILTRGTPGPEGERPGAVALVPSPGLSDFDRAIVNASTDSIMLLALDGRILFANPYAQRRIPTGLVGRSWTDLLSPEAGAKVNRMLPKVLAGDAVRFTLSEPLRRGTSRWWDVVASPVHDARGHTEAIVVVSRDITYQKRSEERATWLAKHDPLTNLPNRLYLQNQLDDMISSATATPFALLLLDLDNFKQVNDTLGHDAGDLLLRAVGDRLRGAVRREDFIARLGGDEFAVVLAGARQERDIDATIAAIQDRLREPLVYSGRLLESKASIGGCLFPRHGRDRTELMKHADFALYAAKASRDSFELFRGSMRDDVQKRMSMLSIAKDALRDDRIDPHYQAQVDLRTGAIAGFEALLRWSDPRTGVQKPDTIAAAFEDIHLAAMISERMIARVIAQMRAWLDAGVPFGHVAVNAAAAEFRRGDFADTLLERLAAAQVPARLFQLEVTETVFLGRGAEYVERALKTLSGAGVTIALDDFGTGYASLSHLKQFPVDVIKIDRSFVAELGGAADASAIVEAVINLGRSLGIGVVAEGIETAAQEAALRAAGCDYGQGYLYSRAVPPARAEALLRSGRAWCRLPERIAKSRSERDKR